MPSVIRMEKESDHSQIDHEEEAPSIILNATAAISTDKTGLRFKLRLQSLSKMEEEEDYNNGEATSGVVSEEKNSSEDSNLIVEKKSDNESKNSPTSIEYPTCPECGKTFPSMKSLYGHLRSHPNRGYRGLHPLPNKPSSKRKSTGCSSNQSRPKKKLCIDSQSSNAAETLLMMSQDKRWGLFDLAEGLEEGELLPETTNNKIEKRYQCNICNKSFTTHQALGGHRVSHNKQRPNSEGERGKKTEENGTVHDGSNGAVARAAVVEHRCKECGETFATGQALGGHMRRHYTGPSSSVASSEEVERNEKRENCGFNLNEVPPLEGRQNVV